MRNYYATFRGNDLFQVTYGLEAENMAHALKQAEDMAVKIEGLTIEQVRITAIYEEFGSK